MFEPNHETVRIPGDLLARLTAYCKTNSPQEACGLLYGYSSDSGIKIAWFKPLRNDSAEPEKQFSFDPEEWVAAISSAANDSHSGAGSGDHLVGIFHSHPAGPAVPSPKDLELIWEFPVYAILSLLEEPAEAFRCYRTLPGSVWRELPVMIHNG